jgi:enoyl-CoA hydratase/carnithine racemase
MISVTRDGAVATIALDRPEAKNALPTAAWRALADACGQVGTARAVILRSTVPGIFSAGADVREFERLHEDASLRPAFRQAMRAGIEAVAALPVPVIAVIEGGCFGAAVALTLAADIRVAGNAAEFGVTPARLGLGYPREDVARLVRQVGRGMAAMLLFTGDKLRADEAYKIGLVELKVRRAQDTAEGIARAVAGNAPQAIALLKRTLAATDDPALDAAFEDRFGGAEFAEGLASFRERRNPVFP